MILRRETPADIVGIAAVHAAAFERPETPGVEPPEVDLVTQLRVSDAWIPALSIVALDADTDTVVGHVVCSRSTIAGTVPVVGLGPLGVTPARHGTGIGSALVHAVLAAADAREERLVGLLGDPAYYRRFGFGPASAHGIEPPYEWYGDLFQVRLLTAATGTERGKFRYPPAFDAVP